MNVCKVASRIRLPPFFISSSKHLTLLALFITFATNKYDVVPSPRLCGAVTKAL